MWEFTEPCSGTLFPTRQNDFHKDAKNDNINEYQLSKFKSMAYDYEYLHMVIILVTL